MGLTTLKIAGFQVEMKDGKPIPKLHADGNTLYLRVSVVGSKSWIQRIKHKDGRRVDIGLGSWPETTITKAREAAQKNRLAVRVDHVTLETKQSKCPSFEEVSRKMVKGRKAEWKDPDTQERRWLKNFSNHVFPLIGKKPIDQIAPSDINNVLDAISAPFMRDWIKKQMGLVLSWSVAMEMRVYNPLDSMKKFIPIPEAEHHKAMPHGEIKSLLERIQVWSCEQLTKDMLTFQILTSVRPINARLAQWSEISLDEKLWTIPSSRMKGKTKVDHRVPLSNQAIELLGRIAPKTSQNPSQWIFSTKAKPVDQSTLSQVFKKNCVEFTRHGFRTSFRCWGSENGVAMDVLEKSLAHKPDKVVGAYDRTDVLEIRRAVMQAWGDYLTRG